MAVAIGSQLGSYEITALLGKGGMGEVYRARDTKLKRDVAIKILPAEFSRDNERTSRFQREAEVLASLNHPNIAAIYDVQQANDVRLLVLELVEGETLADRILRGPIPIDEALEIGRHICEALEAAYGKGIVHRDLKPANVKVTPDGRVKVLDFGLAKAMQNTTASSTLSNSPTLTIGATQAGMILGTAAYMSPEQAGGKDADHRSDVWSFGVVLYEMLSAQQAFPGESVSDILASVLKVEPDWNALPRSTPESIRNVIKRCLTKNVKQRLQAIGEARIAIERQIANPESAALPAEPVAPRSSKLPWILAVAAIAAAVAVSVVHFREPVRTEHVVRFTVPSPDNATMTSFAVSPDGRYVVMASGEVNGKRQLWLRSLDALEAQPIQFTDGAAFPFWSPDSRYIAFFAQGRLKKISASGGPPQVLCSVDGGRGGSWNRDDVIIFVSDTGQIQKVLASGGAPVNLTQPKFFAPAPMFLPDGRSFLYSVTRPNGQNRGGVYVSSIGGGDGRLILEDATNAIFAPSTFGSRQGHLLYLRESTLMARPFDSTNAEFTGEEFPVVEDVSTNPRGPYTPMVVSENGVLIYWNNASISSNEIVWFDRAGKPLGSMGGLHGGFPSISPDDRMLAFVRAAGRSSDVWLWDLARGTDERLTSDLSRNVDPEFSPKGNRVVFRSERGDSIGDLYQRAANGSGQDEPLVKTPNNKIVSQWSRNGFVVYTESSRGNSWDISVVPVGEDGKASGKPTAFLHTEFSEMQGQISPDGRWMAYVSNESGQRQVYVRPFPTGDDKWKISTAGGVQPRWRRDNGQELFFVTPESKFMAVPVRAVAGSKLSFGAPTPLFETHLDAAGVAMRYDVAADGTKFFVETEAASSPARLTVWVNWLAGLKR
jgi:serine/threonine protein kinase